MFFRILAGRVKVRPCFRIVALGKLARMYVDKVFIQSARFLIFARPYHHPIRFVFHFVRQSFAQILFHLFKLFYSFFTRTAIDALVVRIALSRKRGFKLCGRDVDILVRALVFEMHLKIFGQTQAQAVLVLAHHAARNVVHHPLVFAFRHLEQCTLFVIGNDRLFAHGDLFPFLLI